MNVHLVGSIGLDSVEEVFATVGRLGRRSADATIDRIAKRAATAPRTTIGT